MVSTATIGIFQTVTVLNSSSKVYNKGNGSDIIIDNPFSSNSEFKTNINYSYDPKSVIQCNDAIGINLNGLDPKTDSLETVLVNKLDYSEYINTPNNPDWEHNLQNIDVFRSTQISDNHFFNNLLTPSSSFLFVNHAVISDIYSTPSVDDPKINDVYLDPRLLNLVDLSNSEKDKEYYQSKNNVILDGIYRDYKIDKTVTIPQSTVKINDIADFNNISLTNKDIFPVGLHRNVSTTYNLDKKDILKNINQTLNRNISQWVEMLPYGKSLGPKIPYIDPQEEGYDIKLTLNTNLDPLTKLYLNQLSKEEQNKLINVDYKLTKFQVENSVKSSNSIPDLLNRFAYNFKNYAVNNLRDKVMNFTKNLMIKNLLGFNWTTTENFVSDNPNGTNLYTTREFQYINQDEKNEINKIVLNGGRKLFANIDDLREYQNMNKLDDRGNLSFLSIFNLISYIYNLVFYKTETTNNLNTKEKNNSYIYDTNKYKYNDKGEKIQILNKHGDPEPGKYQTIKQREFIKNIITEIYNKATEIKDSKSNNKLIDLVDSTEYHQYELTIGDSEFKMNSFLYSLNNNISFWADRAFSTLDTSTSSVWSLNLENYGVVDSYSNFIKNKKKILPENMFLNIKNNILTEISKAKINNSIYLNIDDSVKQELDKIPDEYKIRSISATFFISGYGNSSDFLAPIIDSTKPIPNPLKQAIIYLNPSQYSFLNNLSPDIFANKNINIKADKNSLLDIDQTIKKLNTIFNSDFKNIGLNSPFKIYRNSDYINHSNINTLRWSYPHSFVLVLGVIIAAFSLVMLALVTYILLMIIKFVLDSLSFSIAIARANGIPKRKIVLAISAIIISSGVIFSLIAFISSYFGTKLMFNFVSGFWFAQMVLPTFPVWSIFVVIIIITMILGTLISWTALFVLKKPILSVLSGNENVKKNLLAKTIRSNKILLSPLWKLRISMLSTKIGKISLISSLLGISFGVLVASFSLTSKVITAKYNSYSTNKYTYAYNYETPQSQFGLIKYQPYSELGEVYYKKGVNLETDGRSITSILNKSDPYFKYTYYTDPLDPDKHLHYLPDNQLLLAKRKVIDKTINPLTGIPDSVVMHNNISQQPITYENIILPSLSAYNKLTSKDPEVIFNAAVSAEIFDVDIGSLGGIPIGNLWNWVANSLPKKIVLQMQANINLYREAILKKYPWYSQFLIHKNPLLPWDDPKNPVIMPIQINKDKVINIADFRFNDTYLKALGIFLGDDQISQNNVLISFNFTANEYGDETFTHVSGNIDNRNVNLIGIKNNSKFIKLSSKSGKFLNNLISNNNSNNVIISEGAAYKNHLSIGDDITFIVKDDYYKDIKSLLESTAKNPSQYFTDKKVTLKVAGISNYSVGQNYWINQNFANNLINLDKGQYIKDIDYNDETSKATIHWEPFCPIVDDLTSNIITNIPYNGIFTHSISSKFPNSSLPLVPISGLYGLNFDINGTSGNDPKTNAKIYDALKKLFSPDLSKVSESDKIIYKNYTTDGDFQKYYEDNLGTINIFLNRLSDVLNNVNITPSINGLDGTFINDEIFSLVYSSSRTLSIIIGLSLTPLLIITLNISILSLADDFRKILTIIRILGLNKRKTISSIALIYLPIAIFGITIGLLITYLVGLSFQSILFSAVSVFIYSNINITFAAIASLVIIATMLACILLVTILLTKEKLEKAIKY
ncbi:MAG: hypothetical protein ACRDCG_00265 [Mycoplasmoidaceae bacterium]